MKKKTYIFTAVALLALLPSCQQETLDQTGEAPSPADYIQFGTPTVILNTESRSITKDALTEGDAFGVLGYCVPYQLGTNNLNYDAGTSLWLTKYSQCAPSVFYNTPVTVNADGTCSYNNLQKWYVQGHGLDGAANSEVGADAEQYRYTFFAYYPYESSNPVFTVDAPVNQTTKGAPKFTFTMPQTGNDLNTPLDHTNTPDAMFGVLYNRQKTGENVSFEFSHLLTALGFEVNNFSERELKIHSITLSGQFFKQIELDFSQTGTLTTATFPESYYSGTYTIFDETSNNNQPLTLAAPAEGEDKTTTGLLPKGIDGEGEHILLIAGKAPYFGPVPAEEDTEESPLEEQNAVHVTISYTFGDSELKTSPHARPESFTPRPGTKYTAQLNFVGDTFVLQFIVNNNEIWEDGASDNDDIIFE